MLIHLVVNLGKKLKITKPLLSKDPAIVAGDKPLMEFYTDPTGDLKVRAWDLRGNEVIAWLHQVDGQQLLNFIHSRKYLQRHTRVMLDILK